MSVRIESKSAVSVCEMARLVGLSRSRFYELVEAGVFPSPIYDLVRSCRKITLSNTAVFVYWCYG
jgi:ACT domain-containing protein